MDNTTWLIVVEALGVLFNGICLVAAVYHFGTKFGALLQEVKDLRKSLETLAQGSGPVCSAHSTLLKEQQRQIDEHRDRIRDLEGR